MAEWAAEPEDQSHSETYTVHRELTAMSAPPQVCYGIHSSASAHTHTNTGKNTPSLQHTNPRGWELIGGRLRERVPAYYPGTGPELVTKHPKTSSFSSELKYISKKVH